MLLCMLVDRVNDQALKFNVLMLADRNTTSKASLTLGCGLRNTANERFRL